MKKICFAFAFMACVMVGCSKDAHELQKKQITIGAKTEEVVPLTKAVLNDLKFNWESTDQIVLAVSNSDNTWYNNEPCTTSGSGADVEFTTNTQYSESDKWNIAAVYPRMTKKGEGDNDYAYNYLYAGDNNAGNAYNGTLHFELPRGYYGYESGKVLMPMVADLSGDDTHPTKMSFKYVGGAVRVVIKDFPAYAASIGLTIAGQKISGSFTGISLSNPVISASSSETDNSVWFNVAPSSSKREFTFVFPVPVVKNPKPTFTIYDNCGYKIWEAKLVAQPSIERASVLDMPELTLNKTVYDGFDTESANDLCGTWTNWESATMLTNGTWDMLKNVTLESGAEFKIRINKTWDEAYPSGNYVVTEAGTYDILHNRTSHEILLRKLNIN